MATLMTMANRTHLVKPKHLAIQTVILMSLEILKDSQNWMAISMPKAILKQNSNYLAILKLTVKPKDYQNYLAILSYLAKR